MSEMTTYAKANGLKGFEMIRAIVLTHEAFTVENDLMTPTFKVKRNMVAKLYENEIKAMYASGDGK